MPKLEARPVGSGGRRSADLVCTAWCSRPGTDAIETPFLFRDALAVGVPIRGARGHVANGQHDGRATRLQSARRAGAAI